MKLSKYNKINEEIKTFISDFQLSKEGIISLNEFTKLHNELLNFIKKEEMYMDCRIGLINAYNKIVKGNLDFIAKDLKESYHIWLWKLHRKIIKNKEKINKKQLPKEIREFSRSLSKNKIFKEGNIYFITFLMGNAFGHIGTIKISDKIELEYNDHSESRARAIRNRLEKKGYKCSEIKILKNIFPKQQVSNNCFFSAEKWKIDGDLNYLAESLILLIDCDWLIVSDKKPYTEEEIENETKILETLLILYDICGILPKNLANLIRIILDEKY